MHSLPNQCLHQHAVDWWSGDADGCHQQVWPVADQAAVRQRQRTRVRITPRCHASTHSPHHGNWTPRSYLLFSACPTTRCAASTRASSPTRSPAARSWTASSACSLPSAPPVRFRATDAALRPGLRGDARPQAGQQPHRRRRCAVHLRGPRPERTDDHHPPVRSVPTHENGKPGAMCTSSNEPVVKLLQALQAY